MGVYKLGNDYRAWFATTVGGIYYQPAGQQSGDLKFTKSTFGAETKDSGGYAVKGVSLIDVQFTLAVEPLLPDANGYTLIETAFFTYPGTQLFMKVRKGGDTATDADTIFAAPFWVTSLGAGFPMNNVVLTPFTFDLAGQPTVALGLR